MTQSVSNPSPLIMTKLQYNALDNSKKPLAKFKADPNQNLSCQTNETSLLLNPMSFRDSTVTYADSLRIPPMCADENRGSYSNVVDSSITTSGQGILRPDDQKQSSKSVDDRRDLVVNWIALIHTKYWFQQETFHLSINIVDRYLKKVSPMDIDFQLLALTSFWVAAKIQQRKIKDLKVWTKLGRGFLKDEILQMESKILEALQFEVIESTTQVVLWELMTKYCTLNDKSIHLCLYMLELSLLSSIYNRYGSEVIALSCIYLCLKVQGLDQPDSSIHNLFLNNWDEVRRCSRKLCKVLQKQSGNLKSPIVRKFASRKYSQVSYMKFGKKSASKSTMYAGSLANLS